MDQTVFTRKRLLTDEEFSMFSFNNSDIRLHLLEEEIKSHKRIPTVYAWNHYILDGHKQYVICQDNHIPYCLVELELKSKDEALIWIFQHLIYEQNYYPKQAISYCIGKYYLLERKMSEQIARSASHSGNRIASATVPTELSKKIGTKSGFQPNTVRKYATMANNLDRISELSPAIFRDYLNEFIFMSYEVIKFVSRLQRNELSALECYFSTLDHVHVTPEIISSFLSKTLRAPEPKIPRSTSARSTIPIIKTMPIYDADSVLSSLTLTIPSWISSIERIKDHADFAHISAEAKERLLAQLLALSDAVAEIKDRLESEENDR